MYVLECGKSCYVGATEIRKTKWKELSDAVLAMEGQAPSPEWLISLVYCTGASETASYSPVEMAGKIGGTVV